MARAEVERYLRERGAAWVEDSTNADDDYARNRLRHGAVPALESVNPAFPAAVSRMAAAWAPPVSVTPARMPVNTSSRFLIRFFIGLTSSGIVLALLQHKHTE